MPPLTLDDLDSLYTMGDASRKLGISISTLKTLIREGELAVVRIGTGRGTPRIPERALLDYVNRRYQRPGGKTAS